METSRSPRITSRLMPISRSATTRCSRASSVVTIEERFDVGIGGSLAEPMPADAFTARVRERLGREPLSFQYGPAEIRRVAIVSGGAASTVAGTQPQRL